MRYIRRRIMRISWTEKKSNKEVMGMAGYKRSLLKTIRKRQLQCFRHLHRAYGLGKQIFSGKICDTKSRGRQRTKYTDSLDNLVTKESPNNELTRKTDDKEDWKAMIADVCYRLGPWWWKCFSVGLFLIFCLLSFLSFFCSSFCLHILLHLLLLLLFLLLPLLLLGLFVIDLLDCFENIQEHNLCNHNYSEQAGKDIYFSFELIK